MVTIAEYLPQQAFALMFILARVGSMLMLVAGIGESFISPRIRMGIALGLSFLLLPILPVPAVPTQPLLLFILLAGEVIIGVFFGLLARYIMAAMDMAGMIIGAQSGLANALIFNPAAASQGALVGYFISMAAVMAVLAMDMHHVALIAIKDSYTVFGAGAAPLDQDMITYLAQMLSASFMLAMQIAAPMIMIGLIFNLAVGLTNRLMPNLQLFFIAMPIQIALGIMALIVILSAGLPLFLDRYENTFEDFIASR